LAFSRSTNSYALTGASRSPARKMRRGIFQDLALLAQDPVLASQAPQLFLLLTRETVAALAFVEIRLFEPEPQRLAGHPQVPGDLCMRFATRAR